MYSGVEAGLAALCQAAAYLVPAYAGGDMASGWRKQCAAGATGLARILQIADKRGGDVVAQTPSGKKKRTGTKSVGRKLLKIFF